MWFDVFEDVLTALTHLQNNKITFFWCTICIFRFLEKVSVVNVLHGGKQFWENPIILLIMT